MVILVGKPDALDQYFMKNPADLFERPFEAAVLDPNNPYVVEAHLPCAAAEIPVTLKDAKFWGSDLTLHLENLEKKGVLNRSAEGEPAWFSSKRNPQLSVNIRSAGETYTIFEKETGQGIGTVDGIRAFKECHPGAIYLHRARQYEVDRLILDKRILWSTALNSNILRGPAAKRRPRLLRSIAACLRGSSLCERGN